MCNTPAKTGTAAPERNSGLPLTSSVPLAGSASLTLLHSLTYATSPTCTASLTCSPSHRDLAFPNPNPNPLQRSVGTLGGHVELQNLNLSRMLLRCMHALLLAGANSQLTHRSAPFIVNSASVTHRTAPQWADVQGQPTTVWHAAPPPATAASLAAASYAPPDAGEAALHLEIYYSAGRGELHTVVEWLREGGPVDVLFPVPAGHGRTTAAALLHRATGNGQLEMVRELLKRGASVDLLTSLNHTALMVAADFGHLPTLLLLLQHSANPDLQSNSGTTALMLAARRGNKGNEACVKALLRAKANTELLDEDGDTALQWAEAKGHTAIAELIRQHAACLPLGVGVALCAVMRLAWPWVVFSVVLGAIATVAFSHTLRAGPGQHRAVRQRRPHRPTRHARAQGRTTTAEPTRQHAASPQPAVTVAPRAMQAAQAARADAAMEGLLAEAAAEQAKGQARSEKSKKKNKAGRAAAAGDEPSEAPPAAAPAPPPTAASAAERTGEAVEAARLAAAEQVQEVAAREVVRAAVVSKARVVAKEAAATAEAAAKAAAAAAKTAAAAEAEVHALERATADGGEGGSSGAAGPALACEAAEVPDDYICPITAEIMTDPVSTLDGFTYERTAITEWLLTKDTSPLTGATLESKTLVPNLSLRNMIRGFSEASTAW